MKKPEPLKNKTYCFRCKEYITGNDKGTHGKDMGFKIKDIKSSVEFFQKYSDSGRQNFKKDFPEEYVEYIEDGTQKKYDFESDESWNSWLFDIAFEDAVKKK